LDNSNDHDFKEIDLFARGTATTPPVPISAASTDSKHSNGNVQIYRFKGMKQ